MVNYDVVIIGSGLGGLSCGAYLAKNGRRVIVLEKHRVGGGYASSFKRGDFSFDACLHMICGVGKGQGFARPFEECGVSEKVDFIKLKYWVRTVFPEHDIRFPSGNFSEIISILSQKFPKEKDGISNFFKEIEKVYNDLLKFLASTAPMWQQLPVFPLRYRALFSVLKKTSKQLLDKHLKDDKLKALLLSDYGFYGLPPSKANPIPLIGNASYWRDGAYYPRGGSHVTVDAFIDTIKQNGGTVLFGEEAKSIIVENGKATGLIAKSGQSYYGEHIVSNAGALDTYHELVGEGKLPQKFISKIDRMEPSTSGIIVYLGLDEAITPKLKDSGDFEIIVSETYDLEQDYQWLLNGEFEKASFLITLYSNVDDSLAKANKFVASIAQPGQTYNYWKKFEAAYRAGNKEDYNKEKDRIAGLLIKRTEKVIPTLSKHIEVIETATPLTMQRYTGNHDGAFYGWANTPKQFSPMDRLPDSPIKNLHLSSAWTFPGEGQAPTAICGYKLARKILGNKRDR
jgi:all-trans-retinol 13,14-reductase